MTNMDIALAAAHTGDAAWMMMCATLVLLMTPALAFFYGGMLGQKSVLNMLMMSYGALAVVAVAYIGWGWSTSFGASWRRGSFCKPL